MLELQDAFPKLAESNWTLLPAIEVGTYNGFAMKKQKADILISVQYKSKASRRLFAARYAGGVFARLSRPCPPGAMPRMTALAANNNTRRRAAFMEVWSLLGHS